MRLWRNLAVDRPEETERHGDLDHVGVDHHEVADSQLPCLHAPRRHHHHRGEARGDHQPLPEVEPRQAHRRLGRGLGVALHRAVVARRLPLLGVEVLHRLEVEEAVDRLLVGVGVALVHPRADGEPPVGDPDRVPDVERDRDRHHDEVPDVEDEEEDAGDERELEHQRDDGEEQEPQQEVDALHPALDDPAEPAGLARDVIAEAERVHVPEGLERQVSQRPLAHLREDPVAELGEPHPGEPHQPVE